MERGASYAVCAAHNSIHVFLWRSHRNTNTVFRLVYPAYDMNTYVFKVLVCSQNRLNMDRIPDVAPEMSGGPSLRCQYGIHV